MTRRYGLRDEQWERMKDQLPGREGTVGVTAQDNRLFVEAVLYRYRSGIPWGDLPERFGDYRVVHTRFSRGSKTGVWEKVFQVLSEDANNEYVMIDSAVVRAHLPKKVVRAEPEASGRRVGGLSTQIHTMVESLGNPIQFLLSPGQASDLQGAEVLLPQVEAEAVLADQAYDAQERVIDSLIKRNLEVVIPSRIVYNPVSLVKHCTKHVI